MEITAHLHPSPVENHPDTATPAAPAVAGRLFALLDFDQDRWLLTALVSLGLGALIIQLYATSWGVGLSPDSAQYLVGARSIAKGDGFSFPNGNGVPVPITLWPPMYSALLALPAMAGADPVLCTRILNGLFFMALVMLSGLLVARITGRLGLPSLAAGSLTLTAPTVVLVHSYAWSEPTFLGFGFLSLMLLDTYLSSGALRYLMVAALCAAASMLARYPGMAFVAAGVFSLLLRREKDLHERLRELGSFLGICLTPSILWVLTTLSISRQGIGRGIKIGGISASELNSLFYKLSLWIVPGRVTGEVRMVVVTIVALVTIALVLFGLVGQFTRLPQGHPPRRPLYLMLTFFAVTYSAFVLVSRMVIEPSFPLDNMRFWTPIYATLTILTVSSASEVYRRWAFRTGLASPIRKSFTSFASFLFPVLAFAYVCLPQTYRTAKWARDAHRNGLGFNSRSWRESQLIAFVRGLPEGTVLYSNGNDVLTLLTGRPASPSPLTLHATPTRDESAYDADLALMQDRMLERQGYFVYFDGITWRRMASDKILMEDMSLKTVFSAGEGKVYTIAPP